MGILTQTDTAVASHTPIYRDESESSKRKINIFLDFKRLPVQKMSRCRLTTPIENQSVELYTFLAVNQKIGNRPSFAKKIVL